MEKVVQLNNGYHPITDNSNFLIGYTAGLCDAYRQTGCSGCIYTLEESNMTYDDFVNAGVEEYDLETLREMYNDK